jgi:hypothetical protein
MALWFKESLIWISQFPKQLIESENNGCGYCHFGIPINYSIKLLQDC